MVSWVDLAIIGILLVFALEAYGRPLIVEFLDFLSFVLSFFLSFRYYNVAAKLYENQFNIPHGLSLVLGFMTIWFLAELIFYLLSRVIIPRLPKLSVAGEGFLAMIPAVFRGFIFISLILVLIATFPIQPTIKAAVENSRLGNFLLKNAQNLEQPVKQVFGGVTNDTLTFLTIKPQTDERVNLGFRTDKFDTDETDENNMIVLVNKERVSRGLKPLNFDPKLRIIARYHGEDMFKQGYFSHYSPQDESVTDRAERFNVQYLVIGENLAYAPSLELAHQGLMNSPGHKANILSTDYSKIGIGVIDGGIYGKMFVQEFTN